MRGAAFSPPVSRGTWGVWKPGLDPPPDEARTHVHPGRHSCPCGARTQHPQIVVELRLGSVAIRCYTGYLMFVGYL